MKGEKLLNRWGIPATIVIFGAGATGSTLALLAQKENFIGKIICLDTNVKRAQDFLEPFVDWEKVQLLYGDFNDINEEMLSNLLSAFIVINTATFEEDANVKIMKIAEIIEANSLDLATEEDYYPPAQFSFRDTYDKKQLIHLVNFGIGPGLTNLIARQLINGLVGCDVSIWVCEDTDSDKIISQYNPIDALNEARAPVPDFSKSKDRRSETKKALSGPLPFKFPNPIGLIGNCVVANENEGPTLVNLPNVNSAETRIGGRDPEKMKEIVAGIKKPSDKKGVKKYLKNKVSPTPTPAEIINMINQKILRESTLAISVEVWGIEPGTKEEVCKRADWIAPSLGQIQIRFPGRTPLQVMTAFMALEGIKRIFYSKSIPYGVWPPEKLKKKDRVEIFTALKDFGAPVLF